MGQQLRNTPTHRICPHCQGGGSVTKNDSAIGDPQQEYDVTCGYDGCVDGWIRTVPADPLDQLKQARQHARTSWGAHSYGRLRMRAMSPVCLPRDRLTPAELIANAEAAIAAFRWAA